MKAVAFIVSNDWATFCSHGTHNGYVAVSPTNPFHGKHYDDVRVDVHGGLTYSEHAHNNPLLDHAEFISDNTEIGEDWWIFGFDTYHYGDNPSCQNKEFVIKETLYLMEQLTENKLIKKHSKKIDNDRTNYKRKSVQP